MTSAIPSSGSRERGAIDEPVPDQEIMGSVLIRGWTLSDAPVRRVDILIDGRPIGPARTGSPRPDVADVFADTEAPLAGFEHRLDLSDRPAGHMTVGAEITTMDGTAFRLLDRTVLVRSSPETGSETARALPRVTGPRPSRPGVRLAALTHNLRPGGAQLYLFELLRRLRLDPGFAIWVVAMEGGSQESDYRSLGIPAHVVPTRLDEPAAYEGRLVMLSAWARSEGIDLVLANTFGCFDAADLASRLDVPFIWAIHESNPPNLSLWDPAMLPPARGALDRADALVFESRATRAIYERYTDPARMVVLPYGIDLEGIHTFREHRDRSDARSALGIRTDGPLLLCMATIEGRKGQALLARATPLLLRRHPNMHLALVGDLGGPYVEGLRSFIDRAGLHDRITIAPVTPDPWPWYAAADLFVLPSDLESMPRSVLEAMAFGLPIVTTDVHGLPELIEHDRTGFLFPPRDLGTLVEALDTAITSPLLPRVAAAAAELVAEHHDASGYAAAYARLIRGLVADPNALPADLVARA